MVLPAITRGATRTLATLGSEMPKPEAREAKPGALPDASPADHQHPRLTSSSTHVTGTNGRATVAFTRTFSAPPAISITALEYTDQMPPAFVVESWVQNAAKTEYTGCVVRAYKAATLPNVILSLTALLNFNVYSAPAGGIKFSCIAVQPST